MELREEIFFTKCVILFTEATQVVSLLYHYCPINFWYFKSISIHISFTAFWIVYSAWIWVQWISVRCDFRRTAAAARREGAAAARSNRCWRIMPYVCSLHQQV